MVPQLPPPVTSNGSVDDQVPAGMSKSGHIFKSIWHKALAQPEGALTFVVYFSFIYLYTASFSREVEIA